MTPFCRARGKPPRPLILTFTFQNTIFSYIILNYSIKIVSFRIYSWLKKTYKIITVFQTITIIHFWGISWSGLYLHFSVTTCKCRSSLKNQGQKCFFLIKGSLSSKKPWEDYLLCCVIFEALCLKFDKNDCIFYGTFL